MFSTGVNEVGICEVGEDRRSSLGFAVCSRTEG